jgi:hypothetical protein
MTRILNQLPAETAALVRARIEVPVYRLRVQS